MCVMPNGRGRLAVSSHAVELRDEEGDVRVVCGSPKYKYKILDAVAQLLNDKYHQYVERCGRCHQVLCLPTSHWWRSWGRYP